MVGVQHMVQHLEGSTMDRQYNGAPIQEPSQTLISEDPRISWVPTTADYHEVVVYIRSGFNGKEIIVQSAKPVVARNIEDEARTANHPPSPELTETTAGASEKSNSTNSDQSVPTPSSLLREADDLDFSAPRAWTKLLLVVGVMTLLLLLIAAGIVTKLKSRSPSLTSNEPPAAGLTSDVPAIFEALSHKDAAVADELKAIQDVLYSSKAGLTSPSLLVETEDDEAFDDFGSLLEQVNKVKDIDRALLMFWFARDEATAMCGNMLRKRILSSDAYEILVNRSISQFCAAEHIDGLVYGHPMFSGHTSTQPQIAELRSDKGEDLDFDFDGVYEPVQLIYNFEVDVEAEADAQIEADAEQEAEASPGHSTQVFVECHGDQP